MLTRCQDVVELVTEHLEGGLTAEEEAAFGAHLRECDGCTVYLAQIASTVGLLHLLGPADAR